MAGLKTKEAFDMLGNKLEEKYKKLGFKYSKGDRILSKASKNFHYRVVMYSAGTPKQGVEINLYGGISINSINSDSFPYSTDIQTDPKHICYNIATEELIQTAYVEIGKKLDNGLLKLMERLEADPAALVDVMADKGLFDYDSRYCADIAYVMRYGTKEQAVSAAQNYYNSLRDDQKKDFSGKYSLAVAGKDYGELKREDYGGFSATIFKDILKYNIQVKLEHKAADNSINEKMAKVFGDFKSAGKVSPDTIIKYRDKVGEDVIAIWEEYGFGSTFKGYLKIINPADLQELLEETYIMPFDEIPVFVTGMGDIIACDSRGNFVILDYRHQRIKLIWTDKKIRWDYFCDDFFEKRYWQWNPYFEAVEQYGEPGYDECFGYEPLLSLGGTESVANLKKMKYQVHISLMGEVQGVLSR